MLEIKGKDFNTVIDALETYMEFEHDNSRELSKNATKLLKKIGEVMRLD